MSDCGTTRNCSVEQKEATTSDEVDSDLDCAALKRTMDLNLRRIALSETQFSRVKQLMKELKLKQLSRRRDEILAGTSSELVARNAEAYEEFRQRNMMAETMRCLEQDSLKRKTDGIREIATTSQLDSALFLKEKMIEEINCQIEYWQDKLHSSQIVAQQITRDPLRGWKRRFDNVDYAEIEEKRRHLSYPLIVYQLNEKQIEDDLRSMDLAMLIADVKTKTSKLPSS